MKTEERKFTGETWTFEVIFWSVDQLFCCWLVTGKRHMCNKNVSFQLFGRCSGEMFVVCMTQVFPSSFQTLVVHPLSITTTTTTTTDTVIYQHLSFYLSSVALHTQLIISSSLLLIIFTFLSSLVVHCKDQWFTAVVGSGLQISQTPSKLKSSSYDHCDDSCSSSSADDVTHHLWPTLLLLKMLKQQHFLINVTETVAKAVVSTTTTYLPDCLCRLSK